MSIVIYSIRYLLNREKSAILKYVLMIIVASLFHTVSILYLLLLLTKLKRKAPLYALAFLVSISVAVSIRLGLINVFEVAYVFFGDLLPQNKLAYLNKKVNSEFIFMDLTIVYSLLALQFISNKLKHISRTTNSISTQKSLQYSLVILVRDINFLLFILLLPMNFVDGNFFRIFRNFFILNYTCFYIGREYLVRKSLDYKPEMIFFFDIVVYIFVIGLFFHDFVKWQSESILKPIFTQNILFNLLK